MNYKCAMCKKEFEGLEKGWSDKEAEAEMKADFGKNFTKEDCNVVCDDCYQKVKPSATLEMFEKYITADLRRNMV